MGTSGDTSSAPEFVDTLVTRKLLGKTFIRSSMTDSWLYSTFTPAQHRCEVNKAKVQGMLRTTKFELRARNMGVTDKT
ncbi:hypothetical protein B9Z19DRAFT_1137295 [Tuber borchii]|uniref:Uncharacterized protein n=1 Tax=Tuber borchii TaxID=42251 RepID=A0A2T6ZAU7_TUBBO|nr:hypothetical protein B9Z19DRAFT_1137295 [Tuber borchii]